MAASIIPFPSVRRLGQVRRTAAAMVKADPKWSEAHLRQQLQNLAQRLRGAGVDEERVSDEVVAFESAIRAEVCRFLFSPGGVA